MQAYEKDYEFWGGESDNLRFEFVRAVVIPESCSLNLQTKLHNNAFELAWDFNAEVLFRQKFSLYPRSGKLGLV